MAMKFLRCFQFLMSRAKQDTLLTLFFDKLKEDRGWYFVEYSPPTPKGLLANIVLVVYDKNHSDAEEIARGIEAEAVTWVSRYDVPVFASACDSAEQSIDLTSVRDKNALVAFRDTESGEIRVFWELIPNERIPNKSLNPEYLLHVYKDVHYRTKEDINMDMAKTGEGIVMQFR